MRTNICAVLMTAAAMSMSLMIATPAIVQAQAGEYSVPTHHVPKTVADGEAPLVGVVPPTQRLTLAIMLPIRNQAGLNQLLGNLYDKNSPLFHRYLSVQEFTSRFAPTQENYDTVVQFAKAGGMAVTDTPVNRRLVQVNASVADIEATFHLIIRVYWDPLNDRTFFAPDREPTVNLDVPLWHIGGLDNFSQPEPNLREVQPGVIADQTGSGPGGAFLGSDKRAAYYSGTSRTGAGQAVGLFELDGYNVSDLQAYYTNVGQQLKVPVNNVLLFDAGAGSDGDDREQVVDIIAAASMAPGLSQIIVYIVPGGKHFVEGLYDETAFNTMATQNLAKQLSVSWSWVPADANADEPIFEEFATQGQTLFVASGDCGSYLYSSTNCPPPFTGRTTAWYPAEDPYATAVGATILTTNGADGTWSLETAADLSGGGLSVDGYAAPSYQLLAGVINSSNDGSTTYRNVPDVSAEGWDDYSCYNGGCGSLGGTSIAAPTWAGAMALVNQNNLATGRSYEGFLNPTIYPIGVGPAYGNYFHDITGGDNFTSVSPNLYSAVSGYDLVTGWGSPRVDGWLGLIWWPAVQYLLQ